MLNEAISLGKRQLVDSIWKSAGIEGLGTTFPVTERILQNMPVETSRDEVLFIVNMKRAWEFLFDNIDYPVNLSFLREINKICMTDILYDPGTIRNVPVTIGGTSWRPKMPDEDTIISDIKNITAEENGIEEALDLFCYIARSQMFLDGNKRAAELVSNKILMEKNLGILSIPYDKINEFKGKLVSFYESGDSTELKSFFIETSLLLTKDGENELSELKEKEEEETLE